MAHTITEKNFKNDVLKAKRPVMVSFWSVWDDVSKASKPLIEKLAHQLKGEVDVFLVNSDENAKISRKYNISQYPTTVIFKGGEVVRRFDGAHPEPAYLEAVYNR